MRLKHTLRFASPLTLDTLKNSIKTTVDEAPQYLNRVRDEKKKIVYDKLDKLNKWYVKIIGLDEVKLYQDRVTSLQEQLLKTQEKRREVNRQLTDIRQKSLELQEQIQKIKRQDNLQRFLDLMREETEVLKLENTISGTFQEYDQTERELFTAFTNVIRDSHEKQRAQIEYTKYFGLVLSIAGSFLAFIYTSVKKQDLKRFIEEKLTALADSNGDPAILRLVEANRKTTQEVIDTRNTLDQLVRYLNTNAQRFNSLGALPESRTEDSYRIPTNSFDSDVKLAIGISVIGGCLFLLIMKITFG